MTRKQRITFHIAIWYYVFLYDATLNLNFQLLKQPLTYSMALVGMVLFYIHYLWLFPQLLKKGRYWQWGVGALLSMAATAGLRFLIEEVIFPATIGVSNYFPPYSATYYVMDNLHFLVNYIVMSVLVSAVEEWVTNRQEKNDLALQSKTAELSFLKSQVNPHFLFNSLNNIYTLAYKKSDDAPDAILKLSGIMRYMLEDSQEHEVLLARELEYMDDYVALQQLRYKNNAGFTMEVHGVVAAQRIAPLLLISFIENIFKHGDVTDTANPARVDLVVQDKELIFRTSNLVKKQHKDKVSGIGQQNVKRRLDLLYAGKYDLKIEERDNHYYCTLKLELA